MSLKYVYPWALAVIIGCASNAGKEEGPPAPIRTNVLTAEEIANTHADLNTAYEAVLRLRPNWLAPRGAIEVAMKKP